MIKRFVITLVIILSLSVTSLSDFIAHPVYAGGGPGFVIDGYPWQLAEKVPHAIAPDDLTWGYTNKAECDDNSAEFNCSTEIKGGWYYRDQWGYDLKNCTSYVAWVVAYNFGIDLSGLGAAHEWNEKAVTKKELKYDKTPRYGDIAVWEASSSSKFGHVALVIGVENGVPQLAEYNRDFNGGFSTDRKKAADWYIHLYSEGTPPPFTRPIAPAKPVIVLTKPINNNIIPLGPGKPSLQGSKPVLQATKPTTPIQGGIDVK